jgi:hydroxymethylpyrimidine/phosphomethylpyrimidine kinase
VTAAGATRFTATRLPQTLRGTGDLLACAIAARLAHGANLVESVDASRAFVRRSFAAGVAFAGTRTVP